MLRYGQKSSKKYPKMGLAPICDPQDFFQKSGSVTFAPQAYLGHIKANLVALARGSLITIFIHWGFPS